MTRILRQHYSNQSDYATIWAILFRLALLIAFIFLYNLSTASPVHAQQFSASSGEILIVGTANNRSWGLATEKLDCRAVFETSGGKLFGINSLAFTIDVEDLKGQNVWMNKNVYKALKGYPFDKVRFNGVNSRISPKGANTYLIKSEGNLNIAGVSQITSMEVTATYSPTGTIICRGSKVIKMSDFNVQLGASERKRMEIGDEVILTFAIELIRP